MEAARLAVVFSGDTRQADKAFGRMDKNVSGFGKVTQKITALQAVAFTAVGAGVLKVAGDFVMAASDVGEQTNVVRESFEGASGAVLEFAENSQEIGIAKAQALEASAAFGGMFDAAGLVNEESATMSIRMVQLAADMASFKDEDPTEMLDKLRSGLAGEAEPLRRFGVFLSEAEVKARAYADGIATTGSELTEAQKIQARYNLILEQTSKAHGDFADTVGESLPNQLRVMRAEWTDLSAEVGEDFLPTMISAVKAMRTLMPVVGEVLSRLPALVAAFAGFKAVQFLPALLVNVGAGLQNLGRAGVAAGGVMGRMGIGLAGLAGPLSAVAAGLVLAWTETMRMREQMEAMKDFIADDLTPALIEAAMGGREWGDSLDQALISLGVARKDLPEFHEKLATAASISDEFAGAMGEAERKTRSHGAASARLSGLALELTGSTRGAATAFGEEAEAAEGSVAALREARDASRELFNEQLKLAGGFLSIQGAAFSLADSQGELADVQGQLSRMQARGNTDTKKYTDLLRQEERAVVGVLESQLGLVGVVQEYIAAKGGEGKATKDAVGLLKLYGRAAGLSGADVRALIGDVKGLVGEYGGLPKEKRTNVSAPGAVEAAGHVRALNDNLSAVDGRTVSATVNIYEQLIAVKHAGGLVKMHAGGFPSLNPNEVVSVLERGEHVTRESSVTPETAPVLDFINREGRVPAPSVAAVSVSAPSGPMRIEGRVQITDWERGLATISARVIDHLGREIRRR